MVSDQIDGDACIHCNKDEASNPDGEMPLLPDKLEAISKLEPSALMEVCIHAGTCEANQRRPMHSHCVRVSVTDGITTGRKHRYHRKY